MENRKNHKLIHSNEKRVKAKELLHQLAIAVLFVLLSCMLFAINLLLQ